MIVVDSAPQRDIAFMLTKVVPALRALIRTGYFSLSVEGAEHIPRQGPVVYVGNHAGWFTLDAFFCGLALADSVGIDRTPWWAVQDQLLKAPLLGRLFERVGGFPASWLREQPEGSPSRFEASRQSRGVWG
jgi:1-acyl-sn-glycerol-3-phosphate acyltransferase